MKRGVLVPATVSLSRTLKRLRCSAAQQVLSTHDSGGANRDREFRRRTRSPSCSGPLPPPRTSIVTTTIVYTSSGQAMGTYEYARWAEPPSEMIGDLLLRQLRSSRRYHHVYSRRR